MSSLAATQADGYYLPPEYYESGAYRRQGKNEWYRKNNKSDSNNQSSPTKPQQVVRFELVDPCVCEKCDHRIGKGTRFNAVKVKIGLYLDQENCPIYEFQTSCRICGHNFCIQTDPQSRGFSYGPGIRKQVRTWDAGDVEGITRNEVGKGPLEEQDEDDILSSLERTQLHKHERMTELDRLQKLQQMNKTVYQDDADRNAELRKVFRKDRNLHKRAAQEAQNKGWRKDMTMITGPLSAKDRCRAAETTFGPTASQKQSRQWKRVLRQSPFAVGPPPPPTNGSGHDDDAKADRVPSTSYTTLPILSTGSRRKKRKIHTVDLTTTTTAISTSNEAGAVSTASTPAAIPTKARTTEEQCSDSEKSRQEVPASTNGKAREGKSQSSGAFGGLLDGYGSSDSEEG